MPDYDELIERIKVLHADEKTTDALYGSTEIIPEEELADSKAKAENSEKPVENADKTENFDVPKNETSLVFPFTAELLRS